MSQLQKAKLASYPEIFETWLAERGLTGTDIREHMGESKNWFSKTFKSGETDYVLNALADLTNLAEYLEVHPTDIIESALGFKWGPKEVPLFGIAQLVHVEKLSPEAKAKIKNSYAAPPSHRPDLRAILFAGGPNRFGLKSGNILFCSFAVGTAYRRPGQLNLFAHKRPEGFMLGFLHSDTPTSKITFLNGDEIAMNVKDYTMINPIEWIKT